MGSQIQLSDFVGEHGSYQLSITILLFVRYILLGLMANSGSLLTPDVTFYCNLPMEEIVAIMPNITMMNQTEQEAEVKEEFKRICQLDLHLYQQSYLNLSHIQSGNTNTTTTTTTNTTLAKSFGYKFNSSASSIRECTDFTYDTAPDQGRTMTSEFDLVCDRDWLRSLFQCLLSAAIVVAHVFWGTFSDKYGRFKAQKLCMVVSLIAGTASAFAVDFWTFAITRSLCSFGDLGLVVSLTTTVVELVGNQYRGLSVAIVNFGFALGVAFLPYVVAYFEDFKMLIACTVLAHIITMPLVLTTNESIRWLLTNRKFNLARRELKRINRWNRHYINQSAELQNQQAKGKKISSVEEKAAFDVLFNKFVEQLESQNLYDPMGETSVESSFASNEANIMLKDTGSSKSARVEFDQETSLSCSQVNDNRRSETFHSDQVQNNDQQVGLTSDSGTSHVTCGAEGTVSSQEDHLNKRAQDQTSTRQPDCINLVASQLSFVGRVSRLFKDKKLMIAVFTIVWTTFNSELQYTSYIIINLEVGEDVYLNYILGGCMEALAAISASLLLSYAPRRLSLITFWLLISLSCFGLSIAHIDSTWAVWLLALAKFSQSCLSSIASVAAYESFPTFLRQSGSGLVFTLGMLGSVFAPLIFAEFDDHAGMDRVLMTFSFSSLSAAFLIYLFLEETRNRELQ